MEKLKWLFIKSLAWGQQIFRIRETFELWKAISVSKRNNIDSDLTEVRLI